MYLKGNGISGIRMVLKSGGNKSNHVDIEEKQKQKS